MSIADWTALMVTASEYTGRDDWVHFYPMFLAFAEGRLNRDLRVRGMETEATLTTDANGEATLPTVYMEMREVRDPNNTVIEAMALPAADEAYGVSAGTPRVYSIMGTTFMARPIAAQDFAITYYARITGLSASNTTNWLLTDAPMLYLAALSQQIVGWAVASGRESDASKLAGVNDLYASELAAYGRLDLTRRYSNMRVRLAGVTP